jgi:hypothetical protein
VRQKGQPCAQHWSSVRGFRIELWTVVIDITVNFIANASTLAVSGYHFVTLLFACVLFVTNLIAPLTEIHLDCSEPANPNQLVPQI